MSVPFSNIMPEAILVTVVASMLMIGIVGGVIGSSLVSNSSPINPINPIESLPS